MKLDKIKFAKLISYLSRNAGGELTSGEIEHIDELISIEMPDALILNPETLHVLMALMHEGTRKIEAIKQHRMMTGYGLKESKDIVEKYWNDKRDVWAKDELIKKVNQMPPIPVTDYSAITSFINNL